MNGKNGVKNLERTFFQFKKIIQYLREEKDTKGTHFSSYRFFI
jgi:hypothetical protein